MVISESSISIDCPDHRFFRFADCAGYREIQNNLREMDVCRYDAEHDILYLIELKDWGNNTLQEESDEGISPEEIAEKKSGISKHRVRTLVEKSIASVCMIMSGRLGMPQGQKIQECYGFSITEETKIKLLSIINWDDDDLSYLSTINSAYKTKFRSFAKLFNISTYLVLSRRQASAQYEWIR